MDEGVKHHTLKLVCIPGESEMQTHGSIGRIFVYIKCNVELLVSFVRMTMRFLECQRIMNDAGLQGVIVAVECTSPHYLLH